MQKDKTTISNRNKGFTVRLYNYVMKSEEICEKGYFIFSSEPEFILDKQGLKWG